MNHSWPSLNRMYDLYPNQRATGEAIFYGNNILSLQQDLNLREREEIRQIFSGKGFTGPDLERIVTAITSDRALWIRTMAVEEYGLASSSKSPTLAALNTFAAFMLCGLVPLVSYLSPAGLSACIVATGLAFFGIGAIKSRWSLAAWWRSGLETFVIGMGAAALAFGVGFGLKLLFGSLA